MACNCGCGDQKLANHRNEKAKSQDEAPCVWWLNSPKNDFYFWSYVRSVSSPDGSMPPRTHKEIAKLMGWSATRTYFAMKEADEALKQLSESIEGQNLQFDDIEPSELKTNVSIDDSFD